MGNHLVRSAFMATASLAAVGAAAPTAAYAQERGYDVSIPAQSLGDALRALGRATRQNIVFDGAIVRGKRSVAVRGRYTPREALDRMLAGTGLNVTTGPGGVLMVKSAGNGGANPSGNASASGDAAGGSAAVEEASAEIVVTGTNIRGYKNVAAPATTLTRDEMERAGYTSLAQVFENLPQNFDEVSVDGRFADRGSSRLAILNGDRATGVDLRGLGADSTLTLVNGARRAGAVEGRVVDISAIPLSAVERVEIVSGGRSAVYGSDAVAGVVNIVTRRAFDGLEASLNYGVAEGGGAKWQGSVAGGMQGERGGFVAVLDRTDMKRLDLKDTGLLVNPLPNGTTVLRLDLQPDQVRNSGFIAGSYDLTENLEISLDALLTDSKFDALSVTRRRNAPADSFTDQHTETDLYSIALRSRLDLGQTWAATMSGTTSKSKVETRSIVNTVTSAANISFDDTTNTSVAVSALSLVFDGELPTMFGLRPRVAAGAEYRKESFSGAFNGTPYVDADRTVKSVFAELVLPIGDDDSGLAIVEISAAARYDKYSDYGDTFNPQAGLAVRPFEGLTLRASAAKAFRVPALADVRPETFTTIEEVPDPTRGGILVPVLFWQGGNVGLGPEKADTWSAGFDFEPSFAPGVRLSFTYFDVKYKDRIDTPAIGTDATLILGRDERFPGLLLRTPTAADITAILASDLDGVTNLTSTPFDPATQNVLTVFPGLAAFDNRTSNIAEETYRGLDASLQVDVPLDTSQLSFGINATYALEHKRSVTKNSPAFSRLNEVGKPVDFRFRANAGWQTGPFSANAYANYTDSYANPFVSPVGRIKSWTTFDLSLGFDSTKLGNGKRGIVANISVLNIFGKVPPPFLNTIRGSNYDPTNASPFGRYMSARIAFKW